MTEMQKRVQHTFPHATCVMVPEREVTMCKRNDPIISAPITVEFAITRGCNHHCIHCYNPDRPSPVRIEMPDWKRNIDAVFKDFTESGVKKIIITGGEPFTVPDRLEYTIRAIAETDMSMSINTNATLIEEPLVKRISDSDIHPFFHVSLPSTDIHSCDEITGLFGSSERIMKGISILESYDMPVGLNFVKTKDNCIDVDRVKDILNDHTNIVHVSISPVIPPEYNRTSLKFRLDSNDLKEIVETLKTISQSGVTVGSAIPLPVCITEYDQFIRSHSSMCSAGRTHCAVDFETGDVMACPQIDMSYGNIYKESLITCWNRMNDWRGCDLMPIECKKCKHLSLCGGDCRARVGIGGYRLQPDIEVPVEIEPVSLEGRYYINRTLTSRREREGYTLFYDDNKYIFVRDNVWLFLESIKDWDAFSVSDLKGIVKIDENFKTVFCELYRAGVIVSNE